MAKQTITGKAFEYSLLLAVQNLFKEKIDIEVVENTSRIIAENCFEQSTNKEQNQYLKAAETAIAFIVGAEPRLGNAISTKDHLVLELAADKAGQSGDVRDLLMIRTLQDWEIGISAKNNHRAVKHPRLSDKINFGKEWLDLPCSKTYFESINPIFLDLRKERDESKATKLWKSLGDYQTDVYLPILNAFKDELELLANINPTKVATKLVQYLIGNQDFYKVIKGNQTVEIQAFNLHGTLNQAFKKISPNQRIQKLKFPSRLVEITFAPNSLTTLLVIMDEGWQISFRIHNASSKIEPSLKFDINLDSCPKSLFTQHLNY